MSGLGEWLLSKLPEAWLTAALDWKLSTPPQAAQQSRGQTMEVTPAPPECLAEEAQLEAADAAYQVALASLQFAVMELIRCQSQGLTVGLSSEQEQTVGLMKSLKTRLISSAKAKRQKRVK